MDLKLSYENSIKSIFTIVSPLSENRYIVLSLN